MDVYEGEKEILARPYYHYFAFDSTAVGFCRWLSYCAFYLYPLLAMAADTRNPVKSKSSILIICIGFLIVHLAFKQEWALYVSVTVGILAVVSNYLSLQIEWIWLKIGLVLSYIVPNILLSLVFFLFLLPLALVSKLFTKDPLMLSGNRESYFVDVSKEYDPESFKKTW